MVETTETSSAQDTVAFGRLLAARLKPGDVVAFFGDLGSGKTTMIKGIAEGLGVAEVVRSPSFMIASEYDASLGGQPVRLQHVDLYRMRDAAELGEIGFAEYIAGEGITLIEWAERAQLVLPERTIRVEIEALSESCRRIRLEMPPSSERPNAVRGGEDREGVECR